jgi:chemotaxis protein MotB
VRAEIARLEDLKQEIQQKLEQREAEGPVSSQIRLDMTRDGLRIQIVDDQNRPMFASRLGRDRART